MDVLQKFLQAEQDFLYAVDVDQRLLEDFAERWQTLWSEWESCLHQADYNTRLLVDSIVARVEELAADLHAFESRSRSLGDDLFNGLEDVFASLTLEDSNITHADSTSKEVVKVPEPPLPSRNMVSPPQWLLRNLHNPYPLPHIRFSNPTMCSKQTKDWFAKARQRIGWTRLLRDRFTGCRSLATDAAFRAYVRDDPTNPLDDDLRTAFLAIKSHAELVYGGEDIPLSSPERVRSISPTPSLTFSCSSEDTDDEHYLFPPSDRGSKRPAKRVLSDTSDSPPPKRRRTYQSLPSPTSQVKNDVLPCNKITLLRTRKRRLSESDNDDTRPKRPRGTEGRPYAVSDSLSVTAAPAWFDLDPSFRFPDPASTDPLESYSFDLDFFNPPSLLPCVVSPIPAPSIDVPVPVDDFSTLFEIPKLDPLQPVHSTFNADWTEFLNFEPDSSLFSPSSSLIPSFTSTPSLVDDVTLSPPSVSDHGPSSPGSLPDFYLLLNEKGTRSSTVGEPIIQGLDFLLPPGEEVGISSAASLLSTH